MTMESNYDYNRTIYFIEPFQNPLGDEPFITDMVSNYRALWQFKNCVKAWSFGMSRFKNFVYLRHCEHRSIHFFNWNTNEKVTLLKNHYNDYVVITLQAIDDK